MGIRELGGSCIYINPVDAQLGRGELIKDTARVLARMIHGAVIRTYAQRDDGRYYGQRYAPQTYYGGRYYNHYGRRCSGTTGTILGAIAGGLLGSSVAGRGDHALGAIIGAGAGALAGRAIDRNDC